MTYYKEEQRLRNPGLIALMILMTGLVGYRVALLGFGGASARQLVITGLIALLVAGCWYAVYRSRLRIKINDKHVKVKMKGVLGRQLKLPTADIVDCTYVDVAPSARWSGALTHPSSTFSCIDFGGRRGICIRMRNGHTYFIGSDDLFERQNDIPLPTHAAAS
ncbi:hypothetical protein GGR28_002435 [Lewinella aquimaris]|uniref:Photosystem I assembly protein Ycf4 n=1 Tax=Neolewinella aquimaris TaxID=1835722 RepID=A0A840ECV6_9BACT|nr:hypothetical protein [Neolewinella aquimaris]MBB4079808.1 hypothetical protein [Neolewinella aquimaris]